MESIAKEIGERIRVYRVRKKCSQSELAERIGSHPNHVGAIERGEKVPTIDTVCAICQALDLPMEVLFQNILTGDHFSELPDRFGALVRPLPEREQADLYRLLQDIIDYHRNHSA